MNEMVSLFVQAIQDYYGAYESAVMADDVARWVGWEYVATLENLNVLLDSVKSYQAVRHGPPDVATIRYALKAWEESGHQKVERVRPPDYHGNLPSAEEIKHENEAMKAQALGLGINTDRPGWMMRMLEKRMAGAKA